MLSHRSKRDDVEFARYLANIYGAHQLCAEAAHLFRWFFCSPTVLAAVAQTLEVERKKFATRRKSIEERMHLRWCIKTLEERRAEILEAGEVTRAYCETCAKEAESWSEDMQRRFRDIVIVKYFRRMIDAPLLARVVRLVYKNEANERGLFILFLKETLQMNCFSKGETLFDALCRLMTREAASPKETPRQKTAHQFLEDVASLS